MSLDGQRTNVQKLVSRNAVSLLDALDVITLDSATQLHGTTMSNADDVLRTRGQRMTCRNREFKQAVKVLVEGPGAEKPRAVKVRTSH